MFNDMHWLYKLLNFQSNFLIITKPKYVPQSRSVHLPIAKIVVYSLHALIGIECLYYKSFDKSFKFFLWRLGRVKSLL